MSPRPRQTSDQQILAATMRVMQRLSPTQLTLAEVAREAGVVPATLIQRFGTKRGLLLAVCGAAPAAARELPPCDPADLARLIQHINDGAMLSWAVYREGPLDKWVRRVLERLLAPYRMAVRRPRRPVQPRRKKH